MRTIFFIDSKARYSADQYRFVFENNLFSTENVEVLVKFRWSSFWYNVFVWLRYRFRLRFVFSVSELHLPAEGGCVFYFFNSVENVKLIKSRAYAHIFLGHGESNKRASLHPLYRMYDYLLVAGPYAGERLKQYGLLNDATVLERVIDIRGAGVADIDFKDVMVIGAGDFCSDSSALLYMPTWEGGLEAENYCTLDHPLLGEFLSLTARKFGLDAIYLKPHPNTGMRIRGNRRRLSELVKNLNAAGIRVIVAKKDFSLFPFWERLGLHARRVGATYRPVFPCAIVDVSASEAMAAKSGVPSIVLKSRKMASCAPTSYESLKGDSVLEIDSWSSMGDLAEYVYEHSQRDYQRTYIEFFRSDRHCDFQRALLRIRGGLETRMRGDSL